MYKQKTEKNLEFWINLIKKHKLKHIIAAFCMLVNSLTSITAPFLLIQIIDKIIPNYNIKGLFTIVLIYIGLLLLQCITKFSADYLYAVIGKRIVHDIRFELINHLMKMSGSYFSNCSSGEILTTINDDVATIEDFSTKMLFSIISDILTSIIMFIFLANLQWDLLLVAIILQPVLYFSHKYFNKKVNMLISKIRECHGDYINIVDEFLSNMLNFIKQNGKKLFFIKYFNVSKRFLKTGIELQLKLSANSITTNVISSIIMIAILSYGGLKVMSGSMTLGVLVVFNTYAQQLLSPVFRVIQFRMNIQESVIAIKRIQKILNEPIIIEENLNGYHPKSISGKIEFRNVSFKYTDNKNVLNNINLICNNNITAIVGVSGSGKTTLTNLLYRLWDVSSGTIYLDDVNIKKYSLPYLRKNISIVSQDAFIFNDTITNNLVLGNCQITKQTIENATKIADIYDYINNLEQRFDTKVGQNGVTLSGGQKQKISIARALLKNSPIIIFDEATSSLDNISENKIQEKLKEYFKGKTIIIIAHRLKTIQFADKIVVLKAGCIVEEGTHQELLNLKKNYFQLYTMGNDKV